MLNSVSKLVCSLKSVSNSTNIQTKIIYSKKNLLILQYLLNYKLISKFRIMTKINKFKFILVNISPNMLSFLNTIKLFSTSSVRKYVTFKQLKALSSNCYFGIISTPIGLLSVNEAILKQVSGELVFIIYN